MATPGKGRASLLGRYRILETVGAGFWGVVYRCWDERLQREVAIKTLHPGLIQNDETREVTRNEALALSSVKHQNIGTVHDLLSANGRDFLVMEFVEGTTLADRIATEGRLPIRDVLRLGIQLASGLVAAHEKKVVHRDIKPGNLRVTPDGTLKVLDFGIARLLNGAHGQILDSVSIQSDSSLNTVYTTAVAGTIPYMSPERIRGAPADDRSDVYGLGVVLYEMATGRHPFPGAADTRLIDRILGEEPPSPRSLNRRIPPRLEKVILKALEKDPERRYQTASEVQADLQRIATFHIPWRRVAVAATAATLAGLALWRWGDDLSDRIHSRLPAGSVRSIALLPFAVEDAPGPTDIESSPGFPGQAFAAEVAAALARVDDLRVIDPASVRDAATDLAIRDTGHSGGPSAVGRALGVDAVVVGTVENREEQVRITLHLVDSRTGRHLRDHVTGRSTVETPGLVRDVARAVLAVIQLEPKADDDVWLHRVSHVDPTAYLAYLEGREWLAQSEREGCLQAIASFERAVALDSSFADAYGALARAYYGVPSDLVSVLDAISKARVATQEALRRDSDNVEAHLLQACLKAFDDMEADPNQNWCNAELLVQQALRVAPSSGLARRLHVLSLVSNNQYEAALDEMHRADDIAPPPSGVRTDSLWTLYDSHQYEAIISMATRSVEEHPEAWEAWLFLGESLIRTGKSGPGEKARSEAFRRMRFFFPRNWFGCAHVRQSPRIAAGVRPLAPGSVIVADFSAFDGDGAILSIDPATGEQTPVVWGGGLRDPDAVAVNSQGEIFALDLQARELLKIDPATGDRSLVSRGRLFESPGSIALTPQGEILVSDWNYWGQGGVLRVDPASGEQQRVTWGSPLTNPAGVAVTASGDLIVTDSDALDSGAVFRIDRNGAASVLASGGYLKRPHGIAIAPDDRIFVADYEALDGTGALLRIDAGTGVQTVVSSGGVFVDPAYVAWAPDGSLWVSDFDGWKGSGRIVCVDERTGRQLRVYEGGALVAPQGIAVLPGSPRGSGSDLVVAGTVRLLGKEVFDNVTIEPKGLLMVEAPLEVKERLVVAGRLEGRRPLRIGRTLDVKSGGVITHPLRSFDGLELEVTGELVVEAGGRIDIDGCGLLGGFNPRTERSGETFDDTGRVVAGSSGDRLCGAGGSHGGRGGDIEDGRAGATYDDEASPQRLGAGGAGGGGSGGAGGGRATIRAANCTVDGTIRANGAAGIASWEGSVGGGGAGGSICLEVLGVLSGSGLIQADGGSSACRAGCGGAGGGGRIAIRCGTMTLPTSNITADGGQGGVAGAAGTVRIRRGANVVEDRPPGNARGRESPTPGS